MLTSSGSQLIDTGIYGTTAAGMAADAQGRDPRDQAETPALSFDDDASHGVQAMVQTQLRTSPERTTDAQPRPASTVHYEAIDEAFRASGASLPLEAIPPGRRRPGDPLPRLAQGGVIVAPFNEHEPLLESRAGVNLRLSRLERRALSGGAVPLATGSERATPLSNVTGVDVSVYSAASSRLHTPGSADGGVNIGSNNISVHSSGVASDHHVQRNSQPASPPPPAIFPGPRYTPSLRHRQLAALPPSPRVQDYSFAAGPQPSSYPGSAAPLDLSVHDGGDRNFYSFASGVSATPLRDVGGHRRDYEMATTNRSLEAYAVRAVAGPAFLQGPRYATYFEEHSVTNESTQEVAAQRRQGSRPVARVYDRANQDAVSAQDSHARGGGHNQKLMAISAPTYGSPIYAQANFPGTPRERALDYEGVAFPSPEILDYDQRTLPDGGYSLAQQSRGGSRPVPEYARGAVATGPSRRRQLVQYTRGDAPPTPLTVVAPASPLYVSAMAAPSTPKDASRSRFAVNRSGARGEAGASPLAALPASPLYVTAMGAPSTRKDAAQGTFAVGRSGARLAANASDDGDEAT